MSAPGTTLQLAAVLALAWTCGVIFGLQPALGLLCAGALACGSFWLAARRLAGTAELLANRDPLGPQLQLGRTLFGSAVRWLLALFLLWQLLERFHPLAILAGLGCLVAAITLQAFSQFLQSEPQPRDGARR